MVDSILRTKLAEKSEFLQHLDRDLRQIEENQANATKWLNDLKETSENIKILSGKVEHTSLVPLAKNIYFNATIVHTGEYYLDKVAFPDSYSLLQTKDQTLQILETKIKQQNDLIEKFDGIKEQIRQRIFLLKGEEADGIAGDNGNMPTEIRSDRGVAVKVGEFYEILEYEEN